jgi:hypothetical protein
MVDDLMALFRNVLTNGGAELKASVVGSHMNAHGHDSKLDRERPG